MGARAGARRRLRPGWLSEFLARCGYWVTGVDVSEDMIRIARRRIETIEEPIGEGIETLAEFHAMPPRALPVEGPVRRGDPLRRYAPLRRRSRTSEIRRTLVPAAIFIHEGVRPAEGVKASGAIAEMEQYGTGVAVRPRIPRLGAEGDGFEDVSRYAAVDELLDVSAPADELRRIEERLAFPPMNTVIAVNPVPAELEECRRASPTASRSPDHGM